MEKEFQENILYESINTLEEAGKKAPEITGLKTGVQGLDELFFITKLIRGKPVKKPLNGYPAYAVINLTGISDTGKSLMAEQFTVAQAAEGNKVCYVTIESPAPFVAASIKQRAQAMGVNYQKIKNNIFIIDGASHSKIREDLLTFLNTLAYTIKNYDICCTVIDSVTGFYEEKEMLARGIVRRLFNFMKKWHQTAIFVSQKRSGHETLTAEAAGGYAVSHIVDCSIVLSKVAVTNKFEEKIYGKPVGELVRLFRIDGCRLCGHDTATHIMEITEEGLVVIGPPLGQVTNE